MRGGGDGDGVPEGGHPRVHAELPRPLQRVHLPVHPGPGAGSGAVAKGKCRKTVSTHDLTRDAMLQSDGLIVLDLSFSRMQYTSIEQVASASSPLRCGGSGWGWGRGCRRSPCRRRRWCPTSAGRWASGWVRGGWGRGGERGRMRSAGASLLTVLEFFLLVYAGLRGPGEAKTQPQPPASPDAVRPRAATASSYI